MNREQSMRVFQGTFEAFDADGNGTIDIDELQLGLSKQHEGIDMSMHVVALENLLKKFDANKNGVLERDEFVALMHSDELEEFFAKEDAEANEGKEDSMDLDFIYNLTPTPEETPTLVEEKLAEFDRALDKIDAKDMKACMMAQERCPDISQGEFKLAFLRCDVFNVEPAVTRWIEYWEMRLQLFGEEKAFLPMTLEGAMKGMEKALSSSYVRVADGVTDPDGRAVVLWDFREEKGDLSDDELLMAACYHLHVVLSSELAQKRGLVHFIKTLDNFKYGRQKLWKRFPSLYMLPLRVSAVHIVKPAFFIKVVLKIMKILMGPKRRNRLYVHSGSTEAVLKSLSKFGFGSKEKLPEVFGGDLSFSQPAKLTFLC